MKKKAPKNGDSQLSGGTRPSPEAMARQSGADPNDPAVAAAIAESRRSEERLLEVIKEQAKQKGQKGPGTAKGWKQNPFYKEKAYDGRAKTMRNLTFEEQSPEFHLMEGVRAGNIVLGSAINYCITLGIDEQRARCAVENLLLPWRKDNGGRCLMSLTVDAKGNLLLVLKHMAPPPLAQSQLPAECQDEVSHSKYIQKQSVKPDVKPVTQPNFPPDTNMTDAEFFGRMQDIEDQNEI